MKPRVVRVIRPHWAGESSSAQGVDRIQATSPEGTAEAASKISAVPSGLVGSLRPDPNAEAALKRWAIVIHPSGMQSSKSWLRSPSSGCRRFNPLHFPRFTGVSALSHLAAPAGEVKKTTRAWRGVVAIVVRKQQRKQGAGTERPVPAGDVPFAAGLGLRPVQTRAL